MADETRTPDADETATTTAADEANPTPEADAPAADAAATPAPDDAAPETEAPEAEGEAGESLLEKARHLAESAVERVKDVAEDVRERAGDVVEAVSDAAEGVVDRVKHVAEDVTEAVSETTEKVVDRAKHVAEDVGEAVSGVAGKAVERARDVAGTVAERLGGDGDGGVSAETPLTAVDSAADLRQGGRLGFTGEIVGRSLTLDELNEVERQRQQEERGASEEELLAMYEGSMGDVAEHQVVTGRVVNVTDKEIVVDFGGKSDGVVSKNEFDTELAVGDEVEVYLDRLEDRRGQPVISKTKADDYNRWSSIMSAFENGTVIEGEIVKRIKGGMIVNLLGAEAFLPGSQVDVRPVRDFDTYLGRHMEFKVVKVNPGNGNVVVSHKALIEKDLQAQRQQILDTLEVGQVLEGVVKNIVNFGAFVDLGGVDGLLHITDLSWGRVAHPSEVVEVEQKLNVVVLDYDRERQRISLGYKQLQSHPWDTVLEKMTEGMEVEGKVVSITDYGAFVEIERGIEGLVHISEMSWTEHVKHPTQKVQLGQSVRVKILRIDNDEKKISLGMKQLEPDPWSEILGRFPMGTITTGKVRNLTTFGAFVELEPGIDGLVHVSDLSWTKRVKHPSEVVRKGQDLKVIVLDIDVAQRRISLGHKQVETDPWQQYETAYPAGTEVTAKVTDVNEGGVVVELPLEAEGFVPSSHLERPGRPMDAYRIGDELTLSVLRLDREERQVILSEMEKKRAAERAERDQERTEKSKARQEERRNVEQFTRAQSGPATIGELSGLAALRDQLAAGETAEAGDDVDGPVAQSEAQSRPVEAAQPEEQEAPRTVAGAGDDLEGAVGTENRGPVGKQNEDGGGDATGGVKGTSGPDEPARGSAQRPEEAGDYPPAEMSQAALKGGGSVDAGTGSLAEQAEAATDDETPVRATEAAAGNPTGPDVESPVDVAVADELKTPAGETTPDDEDAEELGGASAHIEGDPATSAGQALDAAAEADEATEDEAAGDDAADDEEKEG